jgi:hypothetical protein
MAIYYYTPSKYRLAGRIFKVLMGEDVAKPNSYICKQLSEYRDTSPDRNGAQTNLRYRNIYMNLYLSGRIRVRELRSDGTTDIYPGC